MSTYRVWIRLNAYETTFVLLVAENDYYAKRLAEAQYGVGSVLGYTRVSD